MKWLLRVIGLQLRQGLGQAIFCTANISRQISGDSIEHGLLRTWLFGASDLIAKLGRSHSKRLQIEKSVDGSKPCYNRRLFTAQSDGQVRHLESLGCTLHWRHGICSDERDGSLLL